jgi:hypothetical protein
LQDPEEVEGVNVSVILRLLFVGQPTFVATLGQVLKPIV